jgi:transposase-like protein
MLKGDLTMTTQRKPRRSFTAEQKFSILQDIQAIGLKKGIEKYGISTTLYYKWKRQLEVGIHASLRNSKPLKPANQRELEVQNRQLKEIVLNQSLELCELKKTLSYPG